MVMVAMNGHMWCVHFCFSYYSIWSGDLEDFRHPTTVLCWQAFNEEASISDAAIGIYIVGCIKGAGSAK